jgi:hypothetical protein
MAIFTVSAEITLDTADFKEHATEENSLKTAEQILEFLQEAEDATLSITFPDGTSVHVDANIESIDLLDA